jgi:hypothetical protein
MKVGVDSVRIISPLGWDRVARFPQLVALNLISGNCLTARRKSLLPPGVNQLEAPITRGRSGGDVQTIFPVQHGGHGIRSMVMRLLIQVSFRLGSRSR